jgi:hypothetical protein
MCGHLNRPRLQKVEALLKDDAMTLARAIAGKHGGDRGNQYTGGKSSNPTLAERKQDRGKAYTLSRLKSEAPELFARVCEGELSANAAMRFQISRGLFADLSCAVTYSTRF